MSKIARALDEDIRLKKVIDRLSRNLLSFKDSDTLVEGYLQAVKSQINSNSILIIDGSDITKPCSIKMESLSRVRDGSTGEYGNGYHTLGVAALTQEKKMPISVYSKIYSATEETFVSEDEEVLTALKFLGKHFKKSNIRALLIC